MIEDVASPKEIGSSSSTLVSVHAIQVIDYTHSPRQVSRGQALHFVIKLNQARRSKQVMGLREIGHAFDEERQR